MERERSCHYGGPPGRMTLVQRGEAFCGPNDTTCTVGLVPSLCISNMADPAVPVHVN